MLGGARPAIPRGASSEAPSGLYPRPFRIFQSQLQFPRQRLDRRAAALPGAIRLEPQVADSPAPRSDDPADGAEVGPFHVLLVEAAHDVWRHADEGAQRVRRLDAVLAPVPRRAEHHRHLLEVVHEELPGILAELGGFARTA